MNTGRIDRGHEPGGGEPLFPDTPGQRLRRTTDSEELAEPRELRQTFSEQQDIETGGPTRAEYARHGAVLPEGSAGSPIIVPGGKLPWLKVQTPGTPVSRQRQVEEDDDELPSAAPARRRGSRTASGVQPASEQTQAGAVQETAATADVRNEAARGASQTEQQRDVHEAQQHEPQAQPTAEEAERRERWIRACKALDGARIPYAQFMELTGLEVVPAAGNPQLVTHRDKFFIIGREGRQQIGPARAFSIWAKAVAEQRQDGAGRPGALAEGTGAQQKTLLEKLNVRAHAREAAHRKMTSQITKGDANWRAIDLQMGAMPPGTYLAIGPTGLYAVCFRDQGKGSTILGQDFVQDASGQRHFILRDGRNFAKHVGRTLTEAVRARQRAGSQPIPDLHVTPVMAFTRRLQLSPVSLRVSDVWMIEDSRLHQMLRDGRTVYDRRTIDLLEGVARDPQIWR